MGSELTEAERETICICAEFAFLLDADRVKDICIERMASIEQLVAARERQAARDALLAEALRADGDVDLFSDIETRTGNRQGVDGPMDAFVAWLRLRADSETYREAVGRETGA